MNELTIFEDLELEMYNRSISIFKFNTFYALPRMYKTEGIDYVDVRQLPRGRVKFGTHLDTLTDNINLLQPVDKLEDTKKYNFGLIDFKIPTYKMNDVIIYIDNIVIYAVSYIDNSVRVLTEKHIDGEFVKQDGEKIIKDIHINYRINFHPFNGRYGHL